MTSKEFVIWLKGFTEGVHDFNVTPKQWDLLKEKLEQVSDEPKIGTPIGEGGWGTPNAASLDTTVTYTTNGAPNWYSTTIAKEKTLLND